MPAGPWSNLFSPEFRAWLDDYSKTEAILNVKEKDMSFIVKDSGGKDFKQAPAGTHAARCYSLIDIGTQTGEFQGETNKRRQCIIRWELPLETELIDGVQKPLIVSKFYSSNLSEKSNLRRDLEAWRSRAFTEEELENFELENILGKACMVSIIHKDGKARVSGVSAMPKGMQIPPAFNKVLSFHLDDPWDEAKFEALPEGFKKQIKASPEYHKAVGKAVDHPTPARERDHDDDFDPVPF